ncbi:MAG: hypothetical protein HOL12_03520 [Kordiimonadaceae bacterium]|nr:hypothetical protein [Kordiimonadaceae bacterium]MBT6134164.1 hypothetical protein [Kordiimonadaceae bacterium]
MYDINNWEIEIKYYKGADDPKYKKRIAFSIEEIADLYYDFRPDPTDEFIEPERRHEYREKISDYVELLRSSIVTKSFDVCGIAIQDETIYLTRPAIYDWFTSQGETCPHVMKPKQINSSSKVSRTQPKIQISKFKSLPKDHQTWLLEAKNIVENLSKKEISNLSRKNSGINQMEIARKVIRNLHLAKTPDTVRKVMSENIIDWHP